MGQSIECEPKAGRRSFGAVLFLGDGRVTRHSPVLSAAPLPLKSTEKGKDRVEPCYCEDRHYEETLLDLLTPHFEVHPIRLWATFLEASRQARRSIVCISDLRGHQRIYDRLVPFCADPGRMPLVYVTPSTSGNRHGIEDLLRVDDEIVFLEHIDDKLIPAIRRAGTRDFLLLLCRAIRRNDLLPTQIKQGFVLLLTSALPLHSQKQLLKHVHCDRTTLFRQWRNAAGEGGETDLSLKNPIDWIFLLRASKYHSTGFPWSRVAITLKVDRRTLAAIANRVMNKPLTEIDYWAVERAFRRTSAFRILWG